jgi:hypothetical protein
MTRRIICFLVIIAFFVTQSLSSEIDAYLFSFVRMKKDQIITNQGMLGSIGGYAFDGKFGLTGAFDGRNYKIGDFQPLNVHASKWPKQFENFYYLLDYGYAWYEGEKVLLSAGYQNLKRGVGEEYPLFISPNSGSYPSASLLWKPFGELFTVNLDMLFLRNEIMDFSLEDLDRVQTAKTLYYRNYSLKPFDNLRFGYEEAMLFFGRSIDYLYLLSPAPFMTTEIVQVEENGPWENKTLNDNGFMGLFFEFDNEQLRIFGETLVDDFFPEQLFDEANKKEGSVQKVAWNIGGHYDINNSARIGAEFAGATRYTFQASAHSTTVPPYAYTHYDEEKWQDLPIEYNMLGYKYGENSAALDLFYKYSQESWDFESHYEFVCFGNREPFREEKNTGSGFIWLEDPVLEQQHKIKFFLNMDSEWNTHIKLGLTLGTILNKDLIKNNTEGLFGFSLEAKKIFSLKELINEDFLSFQQ